MFALSIVSIILLALAVIAIIGVVIALVVSKSNPKELETKEGSYFDGGTFALIGYSFLVGFVTTITFGLAFPWMCCLLQKWKTKHTVICGKRQYFDGTGAQLIGKFILWVLLTIITFGIYGFWMALAIDKWIAKHTHFVGEEDNNSYFDGGILGFIGTNILAGLVMVVPFVGFAWSNVIKLRWYTKHTVCDSRRLIFVGTVGTFFLKYLLWGFLTVITLGIFALFVPVKTLKLETENTIDHEHTNAALLKASEHKNSVQNAVSMNKNLDTEFKMESLNAGINDTTKEKELLKLANEGLRSAQYLYVVKYGEEKMNEEPFAAFLKASAEAGYAPAMCLYAQTAQLTEEEKNELFSKAAEQGQIAAIKNRMNFEADKGLAENSSAVALPVLEKAVFLADVLELSAEQLSAEEKEKIKKCVLKIRKIQSSKGVASKGSAGLLVGVIVAVVAFIAVVLFGLAAIFNVRLAKEDISPRPNMDVGEPMDSQQVGVGVQAVTPN